MEWKDSNVTLPMPKQNELTALIAQNGIKLEIPAKKVFLKPGDVLTMQAGCKHTIIADTELQVIEVQIGAEISVDDKHKYEYRKD